MKDDVKGKPYISGVDGSFHLADIVEYTTLTVEGPDLLQSTSIPRRANLFQHSSLYSAASSTVSSTPSGSSPATTILCLVVAPRKGSTFYIKIIKAKEKKSGNHKKKNELLPISQVYVELTESTANLDHISSMLKRQYRHQYVIVTSDGVRLEDSPSCYSMFVLIYACTLTVSSVLHC